MSRLHAGGREGDTGGRHVSDRGEDAAPAGGTERLVPLWEADTPGAIGRDEDDIPALRIFRPRDGERSDSSVIVCPGGGYERLAAGHEGDEIARWLSSLGMTACVLRYRLAPKYRFPIPLLDAQRAVRLIRSRSREWQLRGDQIGILGASAGGHLASTVGTHFDLGDPEASDPIERVSCRPDFMILCYPVISMTEPATHLATRENLLGRNPDPEMVNSLSNEKQVSKDTPPVFLFHSAADEAVPAQNSVLFHSACLEANVPAEVHIYEGGAHGLGLAKGDAALRTWPLLCARWMALHGWIEQKTEPDYPDNSLTTS